MEDIGILGVFFLTLYWTALILSAVTEMLLLPICLLLAPFAAVITSTLAFRQGSNVWWYYGLVGALYAVFLLLPWIYLAWRLAGRTMSPRLIMAGYISVYVFWAIILAATSLFLMDGLRDPVALPLVLFLSAVAFVASAKSLFRVVSRRSQGVAAEHYEDRYKHTLRDFVYLAPFVLATAQVFVHNWSFDSSMEAVSEITRLLPTNL